MKTTYVRTTASDIARKLKAGNYKTLRNFHCATGRAVGLSKKQKNDLNSKAAEYFAAKGTATVRTRPVVIERRRGKPIVQSVDERASARPPFAVTFTKLAMNKRVARNLLGFVQEALDAEYTLPDLVSALEMVV